MALSMLHWPNVRELRDESCRIFEAGRFQGAVILSITSPEVHKWVREQVGGDGLLVERLWWPMGGLPNVGELVGNLLDRIGLCGLWCNYWQILNETDLEYPQAHPEEVAQLLWEVQRVVRGAGADWVHLGWPMPQVPENTGYFKRQLPQAALYDFLADRAYWQPAWAMEAPEWGRKYRQHHAYVKEYCQGQHLSIPDTILAEYGCSAPDTPKPDKAMQYRQFVASLAGEEWVVGAAAFIGAGGDYFWDSEEAGRLWIDESMARLMTQNTLVPANAADWYSQIEPQLHRIWAATRSPRVRHAVVEIKQIAGVE